MMNGKRSMLGRRFRNFYGVSLGLLFVFTAMPLAYGQGTDLVVNGGFEANPVPPYPGYTGTITGWTLGGGDVLNNASGPFYQPANGPIPEGSMVYGHQGGGAISQTITGLSHGAICTLKFYRNLRVTAPMKLTVLMGSHVLWGPTRILTTNPFPEETVNFTYLSSWGNTLTFSFTEPEGDATILLDHVRLFVSYTVTPSVTGGNGTIAPNTVQTVNAGGSSAFTMTPSSGYRLSQVLIDGTRIDDLSTTYTFTNIYANHTIAASFALPDWTFNTDGYREGWSPLGHIASSQVSGGLLRYDITTTATDPMWGSQRMTLPRAGYRWLRVIAKNETKCTGSIMFWDDNTIGGFTGGYQHNYPINPHDTQLTEYWVDLNAHALWMAATTIEQFRFDFPDSAPTSPLGDDGTRVDVDRITLLPDGSGPPPPQITSILRYNPATAPPNYTNASQVTWEVRFNHTMNTVAANDFGFTATGSASGAVATVTRIGPTWYRVTANVSGTGTLRLNGVTGGSGRDVANQALSTGYMSGEIYNIDREGPAVAIGAPSTTLTKSGPVTYTVTYTDAGSGFSASTLAPANITLNATGTAAGTVGVSGSGNTRTVTISGITGTGTLGISLAAGTATDALGNTSPAAGPSATFVVDNTPPTALCKNITVNLSAPTVNAQAIDNGSTDNNGITLYLIDGNPTRTFTCAHIPSTTAVLRVQDAAGNFATCTATVTVVDDVNPVAVCQNITVPLSAPTIPASAIDGGSSDNCGVTSLLIDGAPNKTFTCANLGPNTVTLLVGDAAGNTNSCTATVTVVDDINPIAVCQNITVNLSAPTVTASAIDGGSTDNCGVASLLIDGVANKTFTCSDMPSVGVTLTVQDAAGNSATCPATVTVEDDVAPVITDCGPHQTVSADASCQGTVPDFTAAVTASDNCTPFGNLVITQNPTAGTLLANGDHTITVTVTDASGNPAACQAMLTVADDTNPVAVCQDITVNLSAPDIAASAIDGGSSDNCGVTALLIDGAANKTFTCSDMPSVGVVLTVQDAVGNSATCPATVTVVDDVAPVITDCGPNQTVGADASCQGTVPDFTAAVTASDNCTPFGNLVITQSPIAGTLLVPGDHSITVTVTDASGNQATCQTTLTVADDTNPVAACQDITVNLSAPTISASAIDGGSSDNCGVTSLLIDGAADKTFTCGDMPSVGVTLTVQDAAGNSATCPAAVTVVDDITPIAACKDATVYLSSPTLVPDDINNGSSDNCAITSMLVNGAVEKTFTCADIGPNTVTLYVADAAGLFDECTANVTVVNDIAPQILVCPSDPGPICVGYALPEVDDEVVVAFNCEPVIITQDPPAGTPIFADTVVTITAENGSGLTDTCQFTTTVHECEEGEGEPPIEGEGEPQGLTVTADPTQFTVPVGASVTFEVEVSGAQGMLSYQWYRVTPDDEYVIIPDATDGVYTLTDIALEDAGEYQCAVYDSVLAEEVWSPVFTVVIGTGVPVAGFFGLALASAVTLFTGASLVRRRR